jgi:hypothetical protein
MPKYHPDFVCGVNSPRGGAAVRPTARLWSRFDLHQVLPTVAAGKTNEGLVVAESEQAAETSESRLFSGRIPDIHEDICGVLSRLLHQSA